MIKPDREPFCDGIAVFWKFWMVGGLIYLAERTMREIRGKHKTYISKVIEHPSNVVEIQIKKDHTKPRAGQVFSHELTHCHILTLCRIVHFFLLPRGIDLAVPSFHPHKCTRRGLYFGTYTLCRRFYQGFGENIGLQLRQEGKGREEES